VKKNDSHTPVLPVSVVVHFLRLSTTGDTENTGKLSEVLSGVLLSCLFRGSAWFLIIRV
jgi:hypothetical protein